jgi:GTP1/Obg family GTP-binding protein
MLCQGVASDTLARYTRGMPQTRTKNLTKTAPTAIERVQMYLDIFSAHGGDDAITSIRTYESVAPYQRECTRVLLSANDLRELLDIVKTAERGYHS